MHMIPSGLTDTGRVRAGNEDAFLISPPLLIVADGMGGAAAGEVASSLTVNSIAVALENAAPTSESEVETLLRNAIYDADTLLRSAAARNQALAGMGTTVVAAFHFDGRVIIGHIGDSRAYLVSGGSESPAPVHPMTANANANTGILKKAGQASIIPSPTKITRITDDHSVVMEMVKAGIITEDDIRTHPFRNRITRCVGSTGGQNPEFRAITVRPGDILILCSDGLWEMVHEDLILAVAVSASGPEELCRRLVSAANDAGGQDNITVIAAAFSEE